jgi:hypothetical protein
MCFHWMSSVSWLIQTILHCFTPAVHEQQPDFAQLLLCCVRLALGYQQAGLLMLVSSIPNLSDSYPSAELV